MTSTSSHASILIRGVSLSCGLVVWSWACASNTPKPATTAVPASKQLPSRLGAGSGASPVRRNEAKPSGGVEAGGEGLRVRISISGEVPADSSLALLWANEGSAELFTTLTIAPSVQPSMELSLPSKPPKEMLVYRRGRGFAIGYFILFRDLDGNGRLTEAPDKVWEWPEWAGAATRFVTLYVDGPVSRGEIPRWTGGALDEGMHLASVRLTADCDERACDGHDDMGNADPNATVEVLAPLGGSRLPNLD